MRAYLLQGNGSLDRDDEVIWTSTLLFLFASVFVSGVRMPLHPNSFIVRNETYRGQMFFSRLPPLMNCPSLINEIVGCLL